MFYKMSITDVGIINPIKKNILNIEMYNNGML